jgi:hypothetical protein
LIYTSSKTLHVVGFFFEVDPYRNLHYNTLMSTQKHMTTRLQQELEQSTQDRNQSWKNLWQNGLTGNSTAATIVA